jgi:hypothetical protein
MLRRGRCVKRCWALSGTREVVGGFEEGTLRTGEFRSPDNAFVSPSTIPHEHSRVSVPDDTYILADFDSDANDADTDAAPVQNADNLNADNPNAPVAADAQTTLPRPAPPPSSRPTDAPKSAK